MNILALDLATLLGWASQVDGVAQSGAVSVAPHRGEESSWRFIRFHEFLYKWKTRKLDLVVYERPLPNHYSRQTSEMAFGFSTRVEEFCTRERIAYQSIHNSTLKKFATGNGKSDKHAMLKFGKTYWPNVTDDNECDALWLLKYATEVIARRPASESDE